MTDPKPWIPLAGMLLLCSVTTVHAQMTVTPTFLSFGEQQLDTNSEPQSVVLTNTGNASLTVAEISTVGQTPFMITGGSCGPRPFTMAAQANCTLEVTFRPGVEGFQSNGFAVYGSGGVPLASFPLSGTGVNGALEVSPFGSLPFPTTAVGTTSAPLTAELRSSGSGPIEVRSITPAAAPFARVGGTCGTPPFVLARFATCTVIYTFSPTQAGMGQAQIVEFSGPPIAQSTSLVLTGDATQGSQSIDFPAQAARIYGPDVSVPVDPTAVASSGLAVVYGSTTPSVCSVTGADVAIVAAGTCTLTANQPGNASWGPAAQQTRSFEITRAAQWLTFPEQSIDRRDFSAGSSFAIDPLATSAWPNSDQPIVYSSLAPGVCAVAGATVTMIAPGTCIVAADQAGDANHEPADPVMTTVQLVESTDADLAVSQLTDVTQARVGDTVGFTVVVENHGPQDAIHVNVLDLPPTGLGGVVWICSAAVGAECPDPSSDLGGIDATVDLPAGAIVYFELIGTVLPDALQAGVIENTAGVSLPAGSPVTDPVPGNNTASASVSIVSGVVHADGFESLPP